MTLNIKCGNCGSYKVKIYDRKFKIVYGLFFLIVGIISILGFGHGILTLIAIAGVGCAAVGITYLVLALSHNSTKIVCKSCTNVWSI